MDPASRHRSGASAVSPRLALLAILACLLLGGAAQAQPLFTEVLPANPYEVSYLEYRGSATGDYDNDGRVDQITAGPGAYPILVAQNEGDGRFADFRTAIPAGISVSVAGGGTILGDYDRDGDLDLFQANGQWTDFLANKLLRNDRGLFVDVTEQAGLTDVLPTDNAVWLDYDRDGWLDLYTGNPGCVAGQNTTNLLYRNNGDGTFTDVTLASGLELASTGVGEDCTSGSNGGIAAADLDGNGWLDLYLGVFADRNRLFLSNGAGGFTDATAGDLADVGEAFDVAAGDVDNDGDLDLLQAGMDKAPMLLVNLGGGQFEDRSAAAGLLGSGYRLMGQLLDLDNDGDLDAVISWNLHVYLNNGDGTFTEVTATSGIPTAVTGGTAADFDGDGWIDLFAGDSASMGRLFRGISNGNHWLRVELAGRDSDLNGTGAVVTATSGTLRQTRQILGGRGFDQGDRVAHFGLGAHAQVDELEVRWPSGQVDRLPNVAADQRIRVIEGQGSYVPVSVSRFEDLADSLVAGSTVAFSVSVRPALFEPTARVVRAVCDLSAIGGGAEVPMAAQGNGVFATGKQVLSVAPTPGLQSIAVMIDQETVLGPRWTRMSHQIAVLPTADVPVLDEGLAAGWTAETNRVDQLELAAPGTAANGTTACALTTSNRMAWSLTLRTDAPVASYGRKLHFAFNAGTVTPPSAPTCRVAAKGGATIDLLAGGWIDLTQPGWQVVELPVSLFRLTGRPFESLTFSGVFTGQFYLDDVRLVAQQASDAPPTAVLEGRTAALPGGFELVQNWPNPFNSSTSIGFALPAAGHVELAVFNLAGQRVATLARGTRPAGSYQLLWDGTDDGGNRLASGVYVYRLQADHQEMSHKLLLLQ